MGFFILRFREEKEKFLQKSQILRREEKFEIPFSSFEKRKRNLQKGSPFSRREREMDILLKFQEEKENFENKFSKCEKRKRILKTDSPNVRREFLAPQAAFVGIAFYWALQNPKFGWISGKL